MLTQPIHDIPFLFNGLYGVMTDGNSLNYMRARYYSADIRRFVNQDILLGNVADGQSLNRFAFVTGNPISFIDPFGLAKFCGQCATTDCLLYGYNICGKTDTSTSHFNISADKMLNQFSDEVVNAGIYYNIDARAIAAAITWEYEINLPGRLSDYVQYLFYKELLSGNNGIGWGSVHTPKAPALTLEHSMYRRLEARPAIWLVAEIMGKAASRYYEASNGICIHNAPDALSMFFNSSDAFLEQSAANRYLSGSSQEEVILIINQNDMGKWVKQNLDRFASYKITPILPANCTCVNTQ